MTIEKSFTRTSPLSGLTRTRTFTATEQQWQALANGELIQWALPHLSASDREFIMTGISSQEWDDAFPQEDA